MGFMLDHRVHSGRRSAGCGRKGAAATGLALLIVAAALPARAQGTGAPTGVVPGQNVAAPPSPPRTASSGSPSGAGVQRAGGLSQLPEADAARSGPAIPLRTEEGEIGGSSFRIDEPKSGWNHELVVYYHGYQEEPQRFRLNPVTHATNPPTRLIAELLQRGYAVAQPGYTAGGWAIATAPKDAEALRRYFRSRYGSPQRTYVVGQSMGGLLTLLTLEQHAHDYAGGLALCGVLAPADLVMQRAFANRVAFDAFFPGILPDVEHIPSGFRMNDPATATVVENALNAHAPEAALLRSLADIHTNRGLADVLVFNTFVIQDLREKTGGNPFDNRNLIYTGTTDDNALNARVRRYAADPAALHYVAQYGSPTGDLRRPLLALHTTYDPLVPASTAGYYDELTRRLGAGEHFVQQYVNRDGHCNITPEQVGTAFDELTAWAETGRRPEPGRLQDELGQRPVHQEPDVTPAQPTHIGKPQ